MITPSDFPSLVRLAQYHHDGLPLGKTSEHFLFLNEDFQIYMKFDKDFIINARGFILGKFYQKWTELYRSPFLRKAKTAWYEIISDEIDYQAFLNSTRLSDV